MILSIKQNSQFMFYQRSILSLILVLFTTFIISCSTPNVTIAPSTYTSVQLEKIQEYLPPKGIWLINSLRYEPTDFSLHPLLTSRLLVIAPNGNQVFILFLMLPMIPLDSFIDWLYKIINTINKKYIKNYPLLSQIRVSDLRAA